MVMLGTFLPWKARTLVDIALKFGVSPARGDDRWRVSCCLSFVVVIFVNSPATISIISVMGMALISYFIVESSPVRRCNEKCSSLANSWICCRSRTLIVSPSCFFRSPNDRVGLPSEELDPGGEIGMAAGFNVGSTGSTGSFLLSLPKAGMLFWLENVLFEDSPPTLELLGGSSFFAPTTASFPLTPSSCFPIHEARVLVLDGGVAPTGACCCEPDLELGDCAESARDRDRCLYCASAVEESWLPGPAIMAV